MNILFLGTGTSVGVPQIGCTCRVCSSTDARDKRRRTGVYVTTQNTAFVIDTPPEFREACLQYKISRVDAVVLTHAHMDHIAGFDDVRRFNTLNGDAVMKCYAARETIDAMHHIFPYITTQPNMQGLFRPMIDYVAAEEPFEIGDVRLTPLEVEHGPRTNGYLLESEGVRVAYISDCAALSDEMVEQLKGVDVAILDMLRLKPHPTHLCLETAVEYMQRIKPQRGYFVHMSHSVMHEEVQAQLPPSLQLAYDGLTISIPEK